MVNAIHNNENVLRSAIELDIFPPDSVFNVLPETILDCIAREFEEVCDHDEIDFGQILFDFCYAYDFGQDYVNRLGTPKCLIKIDGVEYRPITPGELYDTMIQFTSLRKEDSAE